MNEQTFWDIVKALMTAAAGFAGVWYGQRNLARKDARLAAQEEVKAEQERAYVASVVIEHLERYLNECSAVAHDDGTEYGRPAGQNDCYQTTTSEPQFDPHKLNVNLKVLPPDLIYDILAIRSRQENIEQYLGSPGFDDPPYDEYIGERARMHAELGQQVTQIALRLRRAGGLPNEILTKGDWSRDQGFAEVIDRFKAHKARREQLHRESMARLPPPDVV